MASSLRTGCPQFKYLIFAQRAGCLPVDGDEKDEDEKHI